jgi:hypothetical protein
MLYRYKDVIINVDHVYMISRWENTIRFRLDSQHNILSVPNFSYIKVNEADRHQLLITYTSEEEARAELNKIVPEDVPFAVVSTKM